MQQNVQPAVTLENFGVTPKTTATKKTANIGALEAQFGGKWGYINGIFVKADFMVTQPAAGGAQISPSDFPRVIDRLKLRSHVLGELFSEDIDGPLAKILIEPSYNGYRSTAVTDAGLSIPAAAGDYNRSTNLVLPFRDFRGEREDDGVVPTVCFRPTDLLELAVAAKTAFDGISTGSIIKSVDLEVGAYIAVNDKLYYPAVRRWRLIQGKGQEMQLNLGASEDLWLLSNKRGLSGTGTLEKWLTWTMQKGDVAAAFGFEEHLDRMFAEIGGFNLLLDGALVDPATGTWDRSKLLAMPMWIARRAGAKRSQLANLGGAVNLKVTQSTPLDSIFLASEYVAWTEENVAKVADAFGLKAGTFQHRPKLNRPPTGDAILPGKTRYLPRTIVPSTAG